MLWEKTWGIKAVGGTIENPMMWEEAYAVGGSMGNPMLWEEA
jgi:hypothetical protein